jgi:gliding motility-associated-like protein
MKKLNILLIILLILSFNSYSQCDVVATGYPLEICKGQPVQLMSSGACGYLMLNDFNNGTVGLGWYSNASPMFNNPCPPTGPPANGIVCWIGSATNFPRHLTTIGYDLTVGAGYTIQFAMKYGANQNPTNCESPDMPNEGVHLQYSISGPMGPWTDINYWIPVPGNAATGPYYTWNLYVETVPAVAYTSNTHFRWYQDLTSGTMYDHWGIDEVEIKAASGLSVNVLWNTGDTTFNTTTYPTSSGYYTVTVYDTLYSAVDSVYVIVHDIPTATFTLNTPVCSEKDSVIIEYTGNATQNANYFWQLGGGLLVDSIINPGKMVLNNIKAGQYMIMLNVNENGCNSQIDTMWLEVKQTPMVSFVADMTSGCDPVVVNFINNTQPLSSYSWDFGDGNTSTDKNTSHVFFYTPVDSVYSISLTAISLDGCESIYTARNYITVYQQPVADFVATPDSTSFKTPEIQFTNLSSFFVNNISWDFGDSTSSNIENPLHYYSLPGEYKVYLKVETKHGCTDTLSKIIKIIEEMIDSLIFPNIFTPNGDGFNDFFHIDKLDKTHYLGRQLTVFNRWGKVVYRKDGYLNEWDGSNLPDGTYFYLFTYTFYFHGKKTYKEVINSVTILR